MDEDPNAFPIRGVHPVVFFSLLAALVAGGLWVAAMILRTLF